MKKAVMTIQKRSVILGLIFLGVSYAMACYRHFEFACSLGYFFYAAACDDWDILLFYRFTSYAFTYD